MEVLINNHPIEFELEGEKNVSDLVDSISEWTATRDLIFNEVIIDNNPYPLNQIPEIELGTVQNINCLVQSKADLIFSIVEEGARYCSRIGSFIDSIKENGKLGDTDRSDLKDGIGWLSEVLMKVITLVGQDPDEVRYMDKTVSQYLDEIALVGDGIQSLGEDKEVIAYLDSESAIFDTVREIFRMVLISDELRSLILRSIDSPDILISDLNEVKKELTQQVDNLEQAAIAYQTGKDGEGSKRLTGFIDYIFRFSRTSCQVGPLFGIELNTVEVNGVSLEEKNMAMKDLLDETISIMENNDIISLSDILEYEIKPAMEDLDQYIDLLLESIGAQ